MPHLAGAGRLGLRTAFVGCGYVADFYATKCVNPPQLELVGAADRDAERPRRFYQAYPMRPYPSLEALLGDPSIERVVNLRNPSSHYEVPRACLEAGEHVYSCPPSRPCLA